MYILTYHWHYSYNYITSTATYCHNRKFSNRCGSLPSPKAITSPSCLPPRLPKDVLIRTRINCDNSQLASILRFFQLPASERMQPYPSLASPSRSLRPEGKTPSTAANEQSKQSDLPMKICCTLYLHSTSFYIFYIYIYLYIITSCSILELRWTAMKRYGLHCASSSPGIHPRRAAALAST